MKEIIKRALDFIKNNPSIISSLSLIVVIVGIIFFNSYYILSRFQNNIDALLQKKAVLVEDILNTFISDFFTDNDFLQKKLKEIQNNDSEISEIAILAHQDSVDEFRVIASTNIGDSQQKTKNELYNLAWNNEDRGIAYLNDQGAIRSWDVAKVIKNGDKKIGLTVIKLSLEQYDNFSNDKIKNIYVMATGSAIIVLLLVLNHARLFGYAVRAAKLEDIDKMKNEFISMASHELRTPMTAMIGYIDLLREITQKRNAEEAKEEMHYLENMNYSVERLNQLVEDILEVSRIEQGRIAVNIEKINLKAIIEKVAESSQLMAKKKNLEFNYVKNDLSPVMADSARVEQIMINLVGNAIKYTPSGKVEILIKEDGEFVYLIVADTGLGISAPEINKLFAKFYRIKDNNTAGISGTGLGLWISKQLANRMDGDISVESIVGVGSHFTLKLKKAIN